MDWLFIVFSVGKHTILPRNYVVANAILLIFPDLHRPPQRMSCRIGKKRNSSSDPRSYREFLRAAVSARLGIGMRQVNLAALDNAFAAVFPECTPLNVNKKRRSDIRQQIELG